MILGMGLAHSKYRAGSGLGPETANLLQQFSLSPWRRLRHHRRRRREKKQQQREKLGRPLLPSRSERERRPRNHEDGSLFEQPEASTFAARILICTIEAWLTKSPQGIG